MVSLTIVVGVKSQAMEVITCYYYHFDFVSMSKVIFNSRVFGDDLWFIGIGIVDHIFEQEHLDDNILFFCDVLRTKSIGTWLIYDGSWLASQESLFEGIFSMNICYVMSIYTFWMVGWWSDVINLLTSWYMNSDWGDWLVILFLTGAYRRNKHKTWIHFGSNNLHTHGLLLLRIISPACNKRLQGIHLRCFFSAPGPTVTWNCATLLCNM